MVRVWLIAATIGVGIGVRPTLGQAQKANGRSELRLSPSFQSDDGQPATVSPPLPDSHVDKKGEWEFTLAPYLWASSLRTHVDVGPISTMSEACFTDLLKDLDMGAMMGFEGRKGRWGFFFDALYLSLGDDARARIGPFKARGLDVDAEFTQAEIDFGGMYRFGDPERAFDLMVGGRYTHLETEVSVGPFIDLDETQDFVAPVVGGRLLFELSVRWLMSFKTDFGGFGVGDAADLSWGATGIIGYRISHRTILGFGYRFYDAEFDKSKVDLDVQYHGPIVGMAFSF